MVVGASAWALVAAAAGLLPPHPTPETVPGLALAVLGSMLPDIDHPGSLVGRKLRVVSVPLSLLVGHRGITHSLLAVLACLGLLAVMGLGWLAAPVAVGYLSHLLADALTPSGVPLLWPNRRRFTLDLLETGSLTEWGLVLLLGLGAAWATGVTPDGVLRLLHQP